MAKLTAAQRQQLRAQAHRLKPVIIIGGNGFSAAVQAELERALEDHELIKVRVNGETREDRDEIITALCAASHAVLIQKIGHIAVIYRRRKN